MTGKLYYKELEQKVNEKDVLKLFSHAFESSVDGVAMANTENNIICMNEVFAKMFGYSHEELTGKKIGFLYSDDQMPIL